MSNNSGLNTNFKKSYFGACMLDKPYLIIEVTKTTLNYTQDNSGTAGTCRMNAHIQKLDIPTPLRIGKSPYAFQNNTHDKKLTHGIKTYGKCTGIGFVYELNNSLNKICSHKISSVIIKTTVVKL